MWLFLSNVLVLYPLLFHLSFFTSFIVSMIWMASFNSCLYYLAVIAFKRAILSNIWLIATRSLFIFYMSCSCLIIGCSLSLFSVNCSAFFNSVIFECLSSINCSSNLVFAGSQFICNFILWLEMHSLCNFGVSFVDSI